MLQNIIYPIIVIVFATIVLGIIDKTSDNPENNIRITHEYMVAGYHGLSELTSMLEAPEKEKKINESYLKRRTEYGLNPVLHKYVIDSINPEKIDKVSIPTNNFDYLVKFVKGETTVIGKGDVIDFDLIKGEKIVFLGFSDFFLQGNEGLMFSYKNKELKQVELSKLRPLELDITRSWKVKYPIANAAVEIITIFLWVGFTILFIMLPHIVKYYTDAKYRAMNSSDNQLLNNYLVFRHLKEKNPKRMRDVIKMVRKLDPAQLD